jgi:hypothetical protein
LRPKEIQSRIRSGETVEAIADAAGIPVERVRWFEGPVLAERAYMAEQAQSASVRRAGDSAPGPRLGDIVTTRLKAVGIDPEDAQWDSRKRGDGSWQVQLAVNSGGRLHTAEWVFDQRRRHVCPEDENAGRLSLPEAEFGPSAGGSIFAPASTGDATVTQLAPRLGAAASAAAAGSGPATPGSGPAGSSAPPRIRHERPAVSPSSRSGDSGARPDSDFHPGPNARPDSDFHPGPNGRPDSDTNPDSSANGHSGSDGIPASDRNSGSGTRPAADASPSLAPRPSPADIEPVAADAQPDITEVPPPGDTQARPAENLPAAALEPAAGTTPVAGPEPESKPGQKTSGRQSRKSARGRRSSVPSWDEIMLGSSREQD